MQGCAPGKIEGSSVLCTYKIQGDQHMTCMEKTNIQVTREQKLGAMGHQALLEHSLGLDYTASYIENIMTVQVLNYFRLLPADSGKEQVHHSSCSSNDLLICRTRCQAWKQQSPQ